MLFALLLTACATQHPHPQTQDPVASCTSGEVLDGDACVPEACGIGTWGSLPVDGSTVYVDAAAPEGGDGSDAAPLTSIQAGADLAGGRGGGLVAVAAGTYVETIAMGNDHKHVTLAGRCKELVTIDASEGDEVPGIKIDGGRTLQIAIEGVTLTGGTAGGLWVDQAQVTMSASDLRGNTLVGVLVSVGELTLDAVGVYDSLPDRHGNWGQGIDVESGAALIATDCTIQGNTTLGMYVTDRASADIANTQILDTVARPDGSFGDGIEVTNESSLTARGCTVQGNTSNGLAASGPGTTVALEDTSILDTLHGPDGAYGDGIRAGDGAVLTATRCTIQGNTEAGVLALSTGTTVDLLDTEILDTLTGPDGSFGLGVAVQDGATLTATGCLVQGNSGPGVYALGSGTTVNVADTAVLSNGVERNYPVGGVGAVSAASVSVTGCTIQENAAAGVSASGAETTVDLVDTQVLDTVAGAGSDGDGIDVDGGAVLTADGCTVQGNSRAGLYAVNAGTTVDIVDTEILDTAPNRDGSAGCGIAVSGAVLTATRCTIQGNSQDGLLASGTGTTIAIIDTQILDTLPSPDGQSGSGFEASGGAVLTATRCTIQGNASAAVLVGNTGTAVDLVDTVVSDTDGRGINVQDGATLTASGCTLLRNSQIGLMALDAGTTVDIVDTEVLDTFASANGASGIGISVERGAALTATDCVVQGNTEVGVSAMDSGTLVAHCRSSAPILLKARNQWCQLAGKQSEYREHGSFVRRGLPPPGVQWHVQSPARA